MARDIVCQGLEWSANFSGLLSICPTASVESNQMFNTHIEMQMFVDTAFLQGCDLQVWRVVKTTTCKQTYVTIR